MTGTDSEEQSQPQGAQEERPWLPQQLHCSLLPTLPCPLAATGPAFTKSRDRPLREVKPSFVGNGPPDSQEVQATASDKFTFTQTRL